MKHPAMWLGLSAAALVLSSILFPAFTEPRLQAPAPALTVMASDGRAFDLDAMRGKVVLVVFWATWCGPCLEEMPALEKYYREHASEGFEVIALSIDKPGNRARVFTELAKLSFPGAMLKEASRNGFGTPEALPLSYLVDAQGAVRNKFTVIDARLLDEAVTPLLNEKSATPNPG